MMKLSKSIQWRIINSYDTTNVIVLKLKVRITISWNILYDFNFQKAFRVYKLPRFHAASFEIPQTF
jgi:hypothetical protein